MSAESGLRRGLTAAERFVFAAEDPRRLAAMRIGLFGLLAGRVAFTDYRFVAGQPAELFDPVSLFVLLESMPSAAVVSVLQPLTVAAALAAMAGLVPRISFPLAFAGALFLGLMLNATGKIVHNEVLVMLCLIPLLAVPRAACRVWSPGAGGRAPPAGVAYGWPLRTAMVIIALAYLFVGLQKLRYSGVEWVTGENLRWVLYAASDADAGGPNQLALLIADRAWLAHLLAGATLAVEVGFILCLPFARLRWLFVPGVVGLHLGIWMMMGLDYSAQALTVVIVFVNWVALLELLRGRGSPVAAAGRRAAQEATR